MTSIMTHPINFARMDAVITAAKVKDEDIVQYLQQRYRLNSACAYDYTYQYLRMRGRR